MSIETIIPNWPAPANIVAFTTLRSAGNFALHVNDAPQKVLANRAQLSCSPFWLNQTHSDKVIQIDESTVDTVPDADGSYTKLANKACAVLTADCLPVLLCDTSGQEIAALHAGWRGLLGNILARGVECFSAKPNDILVWLGPAIGPKAFEIGPEVYEAFTKTHPENAAAFAPSPKAGHFYLDIYLLARLYFARMGVTQVYGGDYCTYTDPQKFYSYRAEGQTGRMVTIIYKDNLEK
ncbi:MAG: peptidoglycan editing factor PgeF [Legionellales bacterium]|jgi:hypothetical protein